MTLPNVGMFSRYCPEKVFMKKSKGFHLSGNNDKPFSDENPKF
jgi:hypothetical protein